MSQNGWIKLHRKIRDNTVFADPQLLRLWIICLTEASHKEHGLLVGRQVVKLQPGQFVTGRFELHNAFNQNLKKPNRVSEITVWRWLKTLEELDFLNIKSNNKFSIVSVKKWAEYQVDDQQNDQQVINKRSTNDQQMITNKNVKNEKNDKNEVQKSFDQTEFDRFWDYYPKKVGKQRAIDCWKARVKDVEPSILIQAAINYAGSCARRGTEQQFMKNPSTFLSAKKDFMDYVNPEPEAARTAEIIPMQRNQPQQSRFDKSLDNLRHLYEEAEREENGGSEIIRDDQVLLLKLPGR